MTPSPYAKSARYYDLIYGEARHYQRECDLLEAIFQQYAGRPIRRVLDLGSGTGTHALEMSSRGYRVVGVDVSEEFVRIAREKAEDLNDPPVFEIGDMRDLRVEGEFDALISMFGAFGYVPQDEVPTTLAGFIRKVGEGGLLLFEFWNRRGVQQGHRRWDERAEGDFRLLRLAGTEVDEEASSVEITFKHYVLRGKSLEEEFEELHRLSLYGREEMEGHLRGAGFAPLAILDWDQRVLEPAPQTNFRFFAVAQREGGPVPSRREGKAI